MRKRIPVDVLVLTALAIAGLVVAVLWRVIDPATAKLGDSDEARAAVDGTLALLGIVAGGLTGAFVIIRPGSRPLVRTLVAVLGSALAGLIAWQVGDLLGKPPLRAHGAAFAWPVATCVAVFLGALLPWSATTLNRPALNRSALNRSALNRSARNAAALRDWNPAPATGVSYPDAGYPDAGYPDAGYPDAGHPRGGYRSSGGFGDAGGSSESSHGLFGGPGPAGEGGGESARDDDHPSRRPPSP